MWVDSRRDANPTRSIRIKMSISIIEKSVRLTSQYGMSGVASGRLTCQHSRKKVIEAGKVRDFFNCLLITR
jgi:hypothetical protein